MSIPALFTTHYALLIGKGIILFLFVTRWSHYKPPHIAYLYTPVRLLDRIMLKSGAKERLWLKSFKSKGVHAVS